MKNNESICSQQAKAFITALAVSPDGVRIVVGCHNGTCIVCSFDDDKLNYITSIECKNRMGKYKKGTKITKIEFLDNTETLITTNDSRLRILSVEGSLVGKGSKVLKFKGHKNDNLQIGADKSIDQSYIIWGSEDGYIYIWKKKSDFVPDNNIIFKSSKKERNASYEKFPAFEPEMSIPTVTKFVPKPSPKAGPIIVATSIDGRIRVFHNHRQFLA